MPDPSRRNAPKGAPVQATDASARPRRAALQAEAHALGIDEALISRLVDTFYARIRRDAALQPIFDAAIGDRWDEHLPRMKAFWSSVALNTGRYSGKPVPAHRKLTGVDPWHFDLWLALFEETLADIAPNDEAATYLMMRAERIAESLRLAMFGAPGLPAARSGG